MENEFYEFDDGYSLELNPKPSGVDFQFYTKDGKKAKSGFIKEDIRSIGPRTTVGGEIRKHLEDPNLSKQGVDNLYEKTLIKLADIAEEILIAKNEADELVKELEEEAIKDRIDEGYDHIKNMEHPLIEIAHLIDWYTAGERGNILYAWLAFCSQIILKNPISVIALGEGGSGKSHIIETALELIPDEYQKNMKSSTMAAVYAMSDNDPYFFDGKIINMGDLGGNNDHEEADEFKNIMKEMQTEGYVSRTKMVKGMDGEQVAKEFELFGKPCITFTSVPGHEFDDQEMSRSIMLTPRQDNDLSVDVFKRLKRQVNTPTSVLLNSKEEKKSEIRMMVLALRDRMENVSIENPYGEFMKQYLGKSKYFKRDVDKYDGILRIITAINGFKRELVNNTLFTTKEDIVIFTDLLERYHDSITSNIAPRAAKLLEELRDKADEWDLYDEGISVNDYNVRSGSSLHKRSVQRYFGELNAEGYLKVIGQEGRQNIYVLVSDGEVSVNADIKLSEMDLKIIKFNYDLDDVCKVLNINNDIPAGTIFSEGPDEPVWNDLLN